MVHIRDESARFSQEDFLKLLLGSLGGGGAKYGLCNVLSIFRDIDKLKGLKLSRSLCYENDSFVHYRAVHLCFSFCTFNDVSSCCEIHRNCLDIDPWLFPLRFFFNKDQRVIVYRIGEETIS